MWLGQVHELGEQQGSLSCWTLQREDTGLARVGRSHRAWHFEVLAGTAEVGPLGVCVGRADRGGQSGAGVQFDPVWSRQD